MDKGGGGNDNTNVTFASRLDCESFGPPTTKYATAITGVMWMM